MPFLIFIIYSLDDIQMKLPGGMDLESNFNWKFISHTIILPGIRLEFVWVLVVLILHPSLVFHGIWQFFSVTSFIICKLIEIYLCKVLIAYMTISRYPLEVLDLVTPPYMSSTAQQSLFVCFFLMMFATLRNLLYLPLVIFFSFLCRL